MTSFEDKFRGKIDAYQYDKMPSDSQVNDFFEKFDGQPESKSGIPFYWKLAASVILVLGSFWISWTIAQVEVSTGLAEVKEVSLPDQSVVTLNAESRLSYNRLSWMANRSLELEGEAFFEVTKGERFEVISLKGTTEVLGTSFNIYAREDAYEVKCYTGKVQVSLSESKHVLSPGDCVLAQAGEVKTSSFDTLRQTWKQGEYHYDNAELAKVIKDLERTYGLKFETAVVDLGKKYTGYFPRDNQALSLKLVFEPFGYSYRIEDGVVFLSIKID
ncbi:MAG: FecR domain-containing protein [Cyclobacteriaceae bacterium]